MPLYDFQCTACQKTTEVFCKREEQPTHCKECGGKLERQISRIGFVLKGINWSRDGYGSPK